MHQGSKPPPPDSRTPLRACNGFAYLCDRPYDTVTYATVHSYAIYIADVCCMCR